MNFRSKMLKVWCTAKFSSKRPNVSTEGPMTETKVLKIDQQQVISFLSDKGSSHKTLDIPFNILNLYFYTAYAAHYVFTAFFISILSSSVGNISYE